MFNADNFSNGTLFKVKGDPSSWEFISMDGARIKARNTQNGVQGLIPLGNVSEIINIAKAEIKNEDIKIIGMQPKEETFKNRGRKRNK